MPMNRINSFLRGLLLSACVLSLTACASDGVPGWCNDLPDDVPSADRNMVGCAKPYKTPKSLPYKAWELRFAHPNYMEFWIETANVLDVDNKLRYHAGGGTSAFGYQGDGPVAEGWTNRYGKVPAGSGRRQLGLNLPKQIYVRWKSLIEAKTYEATVDFPEWAQAEMIKPRDPECRRLNIEGKAYRTDVTVGLAPGGKVKVWIQGLCLDAIEVLALQADQVPKEREALVDGKYEPPSPEAQEYIEKYGIPYDTW